jgi:hypothetical protein
MAVLASFVVALALLVVVKKLVDRLVQQVILGATRSESLAILIFALLFLPGTLVHELSHWLAARVLRIPTGDISLLPKRRGRNELVLGYVMVGKADPLRASVIGVAPLVGGSVFVVLLVQKVLGVVSPEILFYNENGLAILLNQVIHMFRTKDVWLYLYLLFTVSNSMLPSAADRHAWRSLLIFVGIVGGVAYGFGGAPSLPSDLLRSVAMAADYLTFAFVITVMLDVAVLAVLVPASLVLSGGI